MADPIGRLVGGLAALTLAVAMWLSSAAISNQVRDPQFAVSLGVPPQGAATGNLGFAKLLLAAQARPKEKTETLVSDQAARLALRGFRSDPLGVRALTVLALDAQRGGEPKQADAMFAAMEKLTRRNEIVNGWRVAHFSQQGNDDAAFAGLDRIMRTNPRSLELYLPAIAAALARPDAVDTLVRALRDRPEWSTRFWNEVTQRPTSHVNASLLRRRLAEGPWGFEKPTVLDQRLIAAMTAAGQFDAAAALACKLQPCSVGRAVRQSRLNNGSFAAVPLLPPFDWQLNATGDFGGAISPATSSLDISALPESGGLVARQLVRLQQGRYVIGWSERAGTAATSGNLRARLSCASAPNEPALSVAPVLVGRGKGGAAITVPAGCNWFWFDLEIVPPANGEGFDMQLDAITLRSAA